MEEEREETVLFWEALVEELARVEDSVGVDKCCKKVMADRPFPAYAANLNSLPIYKWCQLILDCPTDHCLQAIFAQKFFNYFTAKSQSDDRSKRVGSHFFEGVINAHYFGRIANKFKTIENHYFTVIKENQNVASAQLMTTFHAFGLWLHEMLILNEDIHIPSLHQSLKPSLMAEIFTHSKRVNFDFVDIEEMNHLREMECAEWKRLHFRSFYPVLSREVLTSSEDLVRNFTKRLSSYDCPVPPNCRKIPQTAVIRICDTWFTDAQAFEKAVKVHMNIVNDYGRYVIPQHATKL